MARPKKPADLQMKEFVRIPVTSDQKKLIEKAAMQIIGGVAPWARSILVEAARKELQNGK